MALNSIYRLITLEFISATQTSLYQALLYSNCPPDNYICKLMTFFPNHLYLYSFSISVNVKSYNPSYLDQKLWSCVCVYVHTYMNAHTCEFGIGLSTGSQTYRQALYHWSTSLHWESFLIMPSLSYPTSNLPSNPFVIYLQNASKMTISYLHYCHPVQPTSPFTGIIFLAS